jgi:hypothetical protein
LKQAFEKSFSGFCQKFPQAMDEVEKFPNPWTLRVSGKGCYSSKCEKVKITAPYCAGNK